MTRSSVGRGNGAWNVLKTKKSKTKQMKKKNRPKKKKTEWDL